MGPEVSEMCFLFSLYFHDHCTMNLYSLLYISYMTLLFYIMVHT